MAASDIYKRLLTTVHTEVSPDVDPDEVNKYLKGIRTIETRTTAQERGKARQHQKEYIDDGQQRREQQQQRGTGETGGVGGGGVSITSGTDTGVDGVHESDRLETVGSDSETGELPAATIVAADFGNTRDNKRGSSRITGPRGSSKGE